MSTINKINDHDNESQQMKTKETKPKWKKKMNILSKSSKKTKHQKTADCPFCVQSKQFPSKDEACIDMERMKITQMPKEESRIEKCNCPKCQRARGEEPLTTELLPLETQVTLQSMSDTFLTCVVL